MYYIKDIKSCLDRLVKIIVNHFFFLVVNVVSLPKVRSFLRVCEDIWINLGMVLRQNNR